MDHLAKIRRIQAIAQRLKQTYRAEDIVLFGSVAKGEETQDSDTDILVIAPTGERFFKRSATVLKLVRDLYGGLSLADCLDPSGTQRPGGTGRSVRPRNCARRTSRVMAGMVDE
ncbi:MAG: nucleotidyltransferase domain-containing protein [Candidatus Omnitrophica bacterium]|nr:nucleotidyltransferase domain-containing protein [Candidatus Omnitrophota bacterium]